jgi:sugar/nucleoside kinase (ribokinase family)
MSSSTRTAALPSRSTPDQAARRSTLPSAWRRLGQNVGFLGRLSTDPLGTQLLHMLEDEGVNTDWTRHRAPPTTLSIVGLSADGIAVYAFYG